MSKILIVFVILYFASVYSSTLSKEEKRGWGDIEGGGGISYQPPFGTCDCITDLRRCEGIHACNNAWCDGMTFCCLCECNRAVCKHSAPLQSGHSH
ncbi:hypothetical protein ACROYT_G018882 [Oculina patagonica]